MDLEPIYQVYPLYRYLFAKQLEVALCPSRFRALLCSRRAGKTKGLLIEQIQNHMNMPNSMGLYLALTDKSVIRIVFPIVKEIIRDYKVKAEIIGDDIVFENGSLISVLGANHINKIEGFRGTKLLSCIIDEAASFKDNILSDLIDSIVIPALSDLQGTLTLAGTPAPHCSGLFFNITNNLEGMGVWIIKKWSALDNPYQAKQHLMDAELYLRRKKCDEQNPKYRREYLGEWCADDDELMIKPFKLCEPQIYQTSGWRSVIGVDIGFNDETAMTVVGWKNNNPKAYVLRSIGKSGQSVSDIAYMLKTLKEEFKPVKIVVDPAGASKTLMEEFSRKYRIHTESASKTDKAHYIEIMNDALINEELVLVDMETTELQNEMRKLVWNEDRTREREGIKCDRLDATLYAYRAALHYLEQIKVVPVLDPYALSKQMEQQAIAQYRVREELRQPDKFYDDLAMYLED